MDQLKRCPFCAEEIQAAAIKCKHCGESLEGKRSEAAATGRPTYWPGLLSAVLVTGGLVLGGLLAWLGSSLLGSSDEEPVPAAGPSPTQATAPPTTTTTVDPALSDPPGTGTTSSGAGPSYTVGPEVTPEDEADARAWVDEVIAAMRELTGYEARDFEVFLFADPGRIAAAYCEFHQHSSCDDAQGFWANEGVSVGYRNMFVRTDHPRWESDGKWTIYREYIRLLQAEFAHPVPMVSDFGDVPPAGPLWLMEGSTSLFQAMLRIPGYPPDRASMRENGLYDEPGRRRLRDIDNPDGFYGDDSDPSHRLAQFAIYILMEDFGATPGDIFRYFEVVGGGSPWPDTFSEVFGVAIDDFYEHFEDL